MQWNPTAGVIQFRESGEALELSRVSSFNLIVSQRFDALTQIDLTVSRFMVMIDEEERHIAIGEGKLSARIIRELKRSTGLPVVVRNEGSL